MTIYGTFDSRVEANGVTAASKGFVDSPAVYNDASTFACVYQRFAFPPPAGNNAGFIPPAPGTQGGSPIKTSPRCLFEFPGDLVRGEATLRWNIAQGGAESCIIAAKAGDPLTFITVERGGYDNGVYHDLLRFDLYIAGVRQVTGGQNYFTAFPYVIQYANDIPLNAPLFKLPETVDVSWTLEAGGKLNFYVQGILQKLSSWTVGTGLYFADDITLPASIGSNPDRVGFFQTPFARTAARVTARDNTDLLEITGITTERYDSTRSGLTVSGTCNKAATSVLVKVLSTMGVERFSIPAAIAGDDTWSVTIAPIAKADEETVLTLTATDNSGAPETRTASFTMPRILVQQPAKIGVNESFVVYYVSGSRFNDISRSLTWRVQGSPNPLLKFPWMVGAGWDTSSTFSTYSPASTVGLTEAGAPTKFPDNGAYSVAGQLDWWPGAGEYIFSATEMPDLPWSFFGTAGLVTTDLDFFGDKQHRVTISDDYIPPVGFGGFGIQLARDGAKANNGMPTSQWDFHITRVGSEGFWTTEFLTWKFNGKQSFTRYMTSELSNEPSTLPLGMTAPRPTASWLGWEPFGNTHAAIPAEVKAELAVRTGTDIWLNIPRYIPAAQRLELLQVFKATLPADRLLVLTASNEVWNAGSFFFGQYSGYTRDGFARGLGRPGAMYGQDDGTIYPNSGLPSLWSVATAYVPGDFVGTTQGDVYRRKTTGSGGAEPAATNADWQFEQSGRLARQRAHIEDIRSLYASALSVFGAKRFGQQVRIVAEVQHGVLQQGLFDDYLTWGQDIGQPMARYIHAICTAPYFGGLDGAFVAATAPIDVLDAVTTLTGQPRIDFFMAKARISSLQAIETHRVDGLYLAKKLENMGFVEGMVKLWRYEVNQHLLIQLQNTGLTSRGYSTIDQAAFQVDMLQMYRNDMGQLLYDHLKGLHDACGGWSAVFDSFTPTYHDYPTPGPVGGTTIQFWGISDDVNDTGGMYDGVKRASEDFGNWVENEPPAFVSRSRQPQILF